MLLLQLQLERLVHDRAVARVTDGRGQGQAAGELAIFSVIAAVVGGADVVQELAEQHCTCPFYIAEVICIIGV